jgi:uncharacterized membrane protein SpoIIM required for sporulation
MKRIKPQYFLILLLVAALIETYVTPALLNLVL